MDVFISIVGIVLTGCLFVFIGRVVDVALERQHTGDLVFGAIVVALLMALLLDGGLELPLWALIPGIVAGSLASVAFLAGTIYLLMHGARHGKELADRLGMRFRELLRDRRDDRDERE